jgi:mycothione reductase
VTDSLDLLIVGSGSGNSVINPEMDDWSIGIVEAGTFGGTCLNVGCIPTKMYAWAADVADTVNGSARYGVDGRLDGVRWSDIRDRVFGRIDPISDAGRKYRAGGRNTRVYEGTATFTGPRRLVVTAADGARTEISAERVVLANGSRPVIPAIPGLDPALGPVVSYVTNSEVMRIEALPKHVVILGGGYIACEFAHVFAAFGSQVTVISRSPELLRGQDETVTARFTELAQQHWDVRLAATAVSVAESAGEITVTLADGATVSGDLLLVAAGRIPNGDTLEAAAGGVNVTPGGRVVVDAQQRTSAAGVWALGDVSSDYLLKHAANHEARTVSHNLTHPDSLRSSDHRFVPAAVFTDPQIARVGMTEAEARSAGIDYAVKVQAYGDVAYGWAMEDRHGFVKVIAEKGTRRLLGAHLMGFQASTVIQPFIQALSLGTTDVRELARGQYWIHPALAEVVENALLGLDV